MLATGVGSHPGDDQADFDEALRLVLGLLAEPPGLPYLPEVPGRGVAAGMTGRSLALVPGIGVDLQPPGWRLSGPEAAAGVDHRRARSLLARDLDGLEEQGQELAGPFKIQVAGPWTLAATVEKPRGDKVLADHGARRDLGQALAEGLRAHVHDVRRRLPGVDRLVVQVDEPALAAVASGSVPTASGYATHRSVAPPELSETLGWALAAAAEEGAEPWVHSCATGPPLGPVRDAGARGLVVDVGRLGASEDDVLAEALEAGEAVVLGVVPTTDDLPSDGHVVERVERWLDAVGLTPDTAGLALSPACGLADSTPDRTRQALELALRAARSLG